MRLCAFLQGADKSLTRPGRKQTNVSIRMTWISFDALPCRKKLDDSSQTRCCWNRARPWHASELVSFLVGLRTYQHPGMGQSFFLSSVITLRDQSGRYSYVRMGSGLLEMTLCLWVGACRHFWGTWYLHLYGQPLKTSFVPADETT